MTHLGKNLYGAMGMFDPTPVRMIKTAPVGAVAKLGERLNGIQEVDGSIPFSSTIDSEALRAAAGRLYSSLSVRLLHPASTGGRPDSVRCSGCACSLR